MGSDRQAKSFMAGSLRKWHWQHLLDTAATPERPSSGNSRRLPLASAQTRALSPPHTRPHVQALRASWSARLVLGMSRASAGVPPGGVSR
jgi:hypothetical protein